MARLAGDSSIECSNVTPQKQFQTPHSSFESERLVDIDSQSLVVLLKSFTERRLENSVEFISLLPPQVATLLEGAAHANGACNFAALAREQQIDVCASLLLFASEAPNAFSNISQPTVQHANRISRDSRGLCEGSEGSLKALRYQRRIIPATPAFCELRTGNRPSSADDYFGRVNKEQAAASSLTLIDVLRAAIDGKVDPETVFESLPDSFSEMLDKAANGSFRLLSKDAQRELFSAIVSAISATKPPLLP
jgi:hypothetical protein